ncbi:hypothetical protein HYPSUDRAFT_197370 [Hypholoma sublateritium FD-334 SS-4]|uniref:H/ACA ribonucleoprotein complex non-core subunit NAF1 n=1 Tax=Hypholoma sublateritium (strain FD-334 SS-4) TaxID=945553 RepID=A0A0D2PJA8_HYPSF|nr:hypothetical protein HYPSUDRAFT_197370 [Hypholoma sublateritium FD-334 SS-4]
MDAFKLPQAIPQDLLLIQDIIGPLQAAEPTVTALSSLPQVPSTSTIEKEDDDIGSSGEENDSEDEIAADLITATATDEDDLPKVNQLPLAEPVESTSDSESDSDSDSDSSDAAGNKNHVKKPMLDMDDDEDPMPAAGPNTYFTTKHEVIEADIPIPEVDEVGSDEVLEKVGEVMNIVDRLAIVVGLPVDFTTGRRADQALDSETLLVFDDRKVMGYIFETFGPTAQPLYQVKFNSALPLDPERVRVGREVFHVPARSRFVFLSQIKAFKGSDASNVHDEEPADDELEFSDDEAEAAYKSRLKRKRGESRARSVASSRQSTPNPTLMRDQELAEEAVFSRNAYDEHGPYDIDYTAPGPSSRPAPIPYDDPYGDDYTAPDVADREAAVAAASSGAPRDTGAGPSYGTGADGVRRGGDRHEGHGRGRDRDRGGRGGGRGRERGGPRDRGRGRGGGGGGRGPPQHYFAQDQVSPYEAGGETARPLSPTSLAIARATGQPGYAAPQQPSYPQHGYNQQNAYSNPQNYPQDTSSAAWSYGQMSTNFSPMNQQQQAQGYGGAYMYPGGGFQQQNQGYQPQRFDFAAMSGGRGMPPFMQPHINPRFASAFGLGAGGMPQIPQMYGSPGAGMAGAASIPTPAPTLAQNAGLASSSAAPAQSTGWSDEWTVPVQHADTPIARPTSGASGVDMNVQK